MTAREELIEAMAETAFNSELRQPEKFDLFWSELPNEVKTHYVKWAKGTLTAFTPDLWLRYGLEMGWVPKCRECEGDGKAHGDDGLIYLDESCPTCKGSGSLCSFTASTVEVSPRKAARKDSIEGDGGSPGVAEGNFSCAEKEAKTAKEVNPLILDRKEESARVEAEVAAQLANAEWITPKEGE